MEGAQESHGRPLAPPGAQQGDVGHRVLVGEGGRDGGGRKGSDYLKENVEYINAYLTSYIMFSSTVMCVYISLYDFYFILFK